MTFRLTDGTGILGADDAPVPVGLSTMVGTVGLVHPATLSGRDREAWRPCFARQGIVQPIPQLDRDTYALTSGERASSRLLRFCGVQVEAGWLRGMASRGWTFEHPWQNGTIQAIQRDVSLVGGTRGLVILAFGPGIQIGPPKAGEPAQELDALDLRVASATDAADEPAASGRLGAVAASELIRDIAILAGRGAHPTLAASAGRREASEDIRLQWCGFSRCTTRLPRRVGIAAFVGCRKNLVRFVLAIAKGGSVGQ